MYESYYGLTEKPFSIQPDPEYLYLSKRHNLAYTMLEYSIQNHAGYTVICGDIGCGKTTLVHHLINNYKSELTVGLLYNTPPHIEDLMPWIMLSFELPYEGLLETRPDADIVANNLASLLTENRSDIASFNKAYNLSQRFRRSEVPQFKDTFGWASYRVGKYADAGSLFKSAIKQLPNVPDFHYHLGMNYLAKENKVMAREELEKALKLAGDKPFANAKEIRATLEKL